MATRTQHSIVVNPINSEERLVDLYSLNQIYDYTSNQYDCFEEPIQSVQQYGIPIRMLDDACKLFNKNDDLIFKLSKIRKNQMRMQTKSSF